MSKVLLWDIECTNLRANYGYILCIGWKELDAKKVSCPTIVDFPRFKRDPTNDKDLIKFAASELSKADLWVTHYGSRFDVPYVNSRLLFHGMKPMPPIPHIDTWRIARYKMALNSNRLATISEFLTTKDEKTALLSPQWIKAAAGHKPSIRYVKDHCVKDVLVLEEVYKKIRPLATTHPNLNIVTDIADGCPICGTVGKMQKRGYTIARTSKSQRYQCRDCGGWSRGRPVRAKNVEIR
jgi:uncharacterized protein YprB with RNaseH-like and TPR domain